MSSLSGVEPWICRLSSRGKKSESELQVECQTRGNPSSDSCPLVLKSCKKKYVENVCIKTSTTNNLP